MPTIDQINKLLKELGKEELNWFFLAHLDQVKNDIHLNFHLIHKINSAGYKVLHGLQCTSCCVSTESFSDNISIFKRSSTKISGGNRRRFAFTCICGYKSERSYKPHPFGSKVITHLMRCLLLTHEVPHVPNRIIG